MSKLTDKQQAFCEHYVSNGFNATQAAISAGYSENAAKVIASQNLSKLNVAEFITNFQEKAAERAEITVQDLIDELEEARTMAKEQGQGTVLVSATMGKAKLLGFDKQILEHQGKGGGPIEHTNINFVPVGNDDQR